MPEDIALFIDFENIRYSMLNIQRREPDPQELIAVARRYGTVMVARAYADWSRQPEPYKGSLTAAMIDRIDCPAKQRDRIRLGTVHYPSANPSETGSYQRPWPSGTAPLPAVSLHGPSNDWSPFQDTPLPLQPELDGNLADEPAHNEGYGIADYQPHEPSRSNLPYQGSYGQDAAPSDLSAYPNNTGTQRTGNTGHLPAFNVSGGNTVVQSTVVQSTVDLNMLMDIIETVFDRPTISTFVLMTGDKDFTRISARLKLRLNKTVIVVGIPGTVSRDLVSSANQFVPLVPGGNGTPAPLPNNGGGHVSLNANTGPVPAISLGTVPLPVPPMSSMMEVLDPQFLQFLDYIDRNWSWRTIIGVSNFIGDPVNPKNRFRGRLTRESARELLNICIQEGILILQTDPTGAEDLRLNRLHPGVDEVLQQFVR